MHQDQPDSLDAYMDLGAEDIARLVLCLLIEEMMRERLAVYRDSQVDRITCEAAPVALNTA